MNQSDHLLARQRTYQLFSRLYAAGPIADLLPVVAAIPELGAHLSGQLQADQLAAAHYHTFSETILPFESIFRDPSGLLFGDVTAVVAARFAAAGFTSDVEPDAIGAELGFLAFLSAAERAAVSAGAEIAAETARYRQRDFLGQHLLIWLPPFVIALENGREPFYADLGKLTLALVAEHLAELPPQTVVLPPLPAPPDLLKDQSTSLRQISGLLLTPAYSGFYLSREAIATMARALRLPRGFGGRRQILRNLLETAGQYESAGPVLDDLAARAARDASAYAAQAAAYPQLAGWIRPWQERLASTQNLLREMRSMTDSAP
jgi:TorA maturation chaperone TorD